MRIRKKRNTHGAYRVLRNGIEVATIIEKAVDGGALLTFNSKRWHEGGQEFPSVTEAKKFAMKHFQKPRYA